jgi:hypothetical protein
MHHASNLHATGSRAVAQTIAAGAPAESACVFATGALLTRPMQKKAVTPAGATARNNANS